VRNRQKAFRMRGIKSLEPSKKLNALLLEYFHRRFQTLPRLRAFGNHFLLTPPRLRSVLDHLIQRTKMLCTAMALVKGMVKWVL
jgi:hypothetical protein